MPADVSRLLMALYLSYKTGIIVLCDIAFQAQPSVLFVCRCIASILLSVVNTVLSHHPRIVAATSDRR